MAVFVAVVGAIAALLSPALVPYFMGNPVVNGSHSLPPVRLR